MSERVANNSTAAYTDISFLRRMHKVSLTTFASVEHTSVAFSIFPLLYQTRGRLITVYSESRIPNSHHFCHLEDNEV